MLCLFTAVVTTRPQDPPFPSSYPGIILSDEHAWLKPAVWMAQDPLNHQIMPVGCMAYVYPCIGPLGFCMCTGACLYPFRLLNDLFQTDCPFSSVFLGRYPKPLWIQEKRKEESSPHLLYSETRSSLIFREIRPAFVPDGFAVCRSSPFFWSRIQ